MTGFKSFGPQFAPKPQYIQSALASVCDELPSGFVDLRIFEPRFTDIFTAGAAHLGRHLKDFLPHENAWPELPVICVNRFNPLAGKVDLFLHTLTRLIYRLSNYDRALDSASTFPYISICAMEGYSSPHHHSFDGVLYEIKDPVWKQHSRSVIWGCSCSTLSYTKRMAEERGLVFEGDAFDLERFLGRS